MALIALGGCQPNLRFLYARLRHRWRILRASAVINEMVANPDLLRVTHRNGESYFYTPVDPERPTDALGIPK
ncbi:MAG TPA: hypothetical protein VKA15_10500 [Isosphaeraceae bacterium]|nr:hypothetical protein [Isosphaeraceae bacterium]